MNLLGRLASALIILLAFLPRPASAQERDPLSGRWNLVLQTPQGMFPMPTEFLLSADRRVTATILGPSGSFRITDATGRLEDGSLRLSIRSSYGNLRVRARLEGDRLSGTWSPAGLVSGLLFRGALSGVRDPGHVRRPPAEIFDAVWTQLDRHFYAPDFNGVDMAALRERHRPRIAAARTEGELVRGMRAMLAELLTSHLALFATPAPLEEPAPPRDGLATEGITWRQLAPTIGYLRIDSFEDGQAVMDRIDRAFAELAGNEALVIDIRENGGGSLSAAMRLGDHIFAEQRPVGYFAGREGLARHGVRSIDQLDRTALPLFTGYQSAELHRAMADSGAVMLATGGRVPALYRGRIALLIDEYCFSACEAFASVAKESGVATLVGRKTAGAMLASFPFAIEGGWTLLLPVWDFRTPQGMQVEGRGVEPHLVVRRGRGDPELANALRVLRRPASP